MSKIKYEMEGSSYSRRNIFKRQTLDYGPYYREEMSSARIITESELKELLFRIERGLVTSINLSERGVDNHAFVQIMTAANVNKISDIDFSNNQIGDDAIERVVSILSKNTKILTLNLAYNKITVKGARIFINILKNNYTIESINLFNNPIDLSKLKELQALIDRNMQIKRELEKTEFYNSIRKELSDKALSAGIRGIIMEYFNAAEHEEARDLVKKMLYPFDDATIRSNHLIGARMTSENLEIETVVEVRSDQEPLLFSNASMRRGKGFSKVHEICVNLKDMCTIL